MPCEPRVEEGVELAVPPQDVVQEVPRPHNVPGRHPVADQKRLKGRQNGLTLRPRGEAALPKGHHTANSEVS